MLIYKKIYEYLEDKIKNENNRLIDFTKISDTMNTDTIKDICTEAKNNKFYAVSILPQFVTIVKSFSDDIFKVSAIIDYPKGENSTKFKINEIEKSIVNGANEIDIVVNYNLIKNKSDHDKLHKEIREITEYCHKESVIIKITIEIGALSYQEIEDICNMCVDTNVDFITTSTGKLSRDDSFETKLEKVKFMRKILPDETKIKFTGGIRSNQQIEQLKNLVERIGTSQIIN